MKTGKIRFRTVNQARSPWVPEGGPAFLTDPRRGCAPDKIDDLDLFYSESPAGRARAIAICREECPFRRRCDAYATERREKWGIWGGRSRDPRLIPVDDQKVYQMWRRQYTDEMIAAHLGSNVRAVRISRKRQGLFTPSDDEGLSTPQL